MAETINKIEENLLLFSAEYLQQKTYWTSRLSYEEETELITPMPCGDETAIMRRVPISLPAHTVEKVLKLANNTDLSVLIIQLSALLVLLKKYTGINRHSIITPVNIHTSQPALNKYVLIQESVDDAISFKELLLKTGKSVLEAYNNQDYPLPDLLKEMGVTGNRRLSGIVCRMEHLHGNESVQNATDLIFSFEKQQANIDAYFSYNALCYDATIVQQVAEHYVRLLNELTANLNMNVDAIEVLNEEERADLLKCRSTVELPSSTFVELFEEQARLFPHEIAVRFEGNSITYNELNDAANRLAHFLVRTVAPAPDNIIAIIMDRSPEMMQCILAAWKCGAAYMPVDTTFPPDRVAAILVRAKPVAILTERKYAQVAAFEEKQFIIEEISSESSGDPGLQRNPGNLAYVMFTSGSTGEPKGAMIEHRGMLNHLLAKVSDLQIDRNTTIVQNSSQCFDISVWQFFAALLKGGKTVIIPNETILDAGKFWDCVQQEHATILEVVPSYLSVMLDSIEARNEVSNLKYLVATGETLNPELTRRWFGLFPNVSLVNAYGPTEASDDITHFITDKPVTGAITPIGLPICNTQIYILNERRELCPKGVTGQLYVAGPCVGRGYLHNDEATKAAFITDHIDTANPKRMYRTGDMARYLPNGMIECRGRKDHQVKINGFRIELGEIENWMLRLEGIVDVVVKDVTSSSGNKNLCAWYIAKENTSVENEQIRQWLSGKLPVYMVPAYFVRMSEFPLTGNGKVNRNALPLPRYIDRSLLPVAHAVTGIEKRVAELWQSILGVSEVNLHDNFFSLGGHSLSATRLALHLNKEFGVKLDLKTIFQHATVAELVQVILQAEIGEHQSIQQLPRQASYETSQSQKRLWIINEMEEEKYVYNIPESYVFNGHLDREKFARSVKQLVERHEILRTTFINADGQPKQKVHTPEEFGFEVQVIDLSANSDKEKTVKQFVQAEEKYPFDLEKGPLIRAILLKLEEERHVFLLTLHHIVADGWSLDVMKNEVFALYNAYLSGEPESLAPVTIQYKDYAAWQRKQISSPAFRLHRQYWLDLYSDEIPILDFPADYTRPAEKTYKGRSIEGSLGKELSRLVLDHCQSSNVSLFMFLLASVKVLMYKYSGQVDMVIGTPIAGRSHLNMEDQVGFYVNLLPVRTKFEPQTNFSTLLQQVKTNALEAYQHQLYPFDHLVDDLSLERDLSRSPLFDVLVVLQNIDLIQSGARSMNGITVDNFPLERSVVKYDLSFNFSHTEDDIMLSFEYNDDLYSPQRMEQLISHYKSIIQAIIAHSDTPLVAVDYLSDAEKEELTFQYNNTHRPYDDSSTILELLQAQLNKTPQSIALRCNGQRFTYEQLNHVANQLAHYLIDVKKVAAGDHVSVLLDRSEWSVISMLAILKTGACYVPLETQLPAERVQYILKDLDPKVTLTNAAIEEIDLSVYPSHNPPTTITAGHSSYIIYTSGSTGYPKGVIQTHRTLFNLIWWQMEAWKAEPGLRFLQHASFGFDASLHDVLYALSTGGEVFLLDEETRADFTRIKNILITENIDVIWFTFSALAALFHEIEDAFDQVKLKHIVTTGEAAGLNNKLGKYISNNPGTVLHNFYGPSETHVVTSYDVPGGKSQLMTNVPIGTPVFNTRTFILNEAFQLQPKGVAGEIYVETDNIFAGYLHRDDLTARCFVPNPFNPGKPLYKTGDFAHLMFDGNIHFIGRKDHQVKIRGFRIELKEIEFHLLQFPGVEKALVICRTNKSKDKVITAYLTVSQSVQVPVLYNYLNEKLPAYMVPAHFIVLDEFPVNKNGKIDKNALPAPPDVEQAESFVAPATDTEQKLADIWIEILGKEKIGVTDNFFRIGGHSLGATRMASRILKEFDVDINLRKIYRHSTIRELALEINARQWVRGPVSQDETIMEKLLI